MRYWSLLFSLQPPDWLWIVSNKCEFMTKQEDGHVSCELPASSCLRARAKARPTTCDPAMMTWIRYLPACGKRNAVTGRKDHVSIPSDVVVAQGTRGGRDV